MMICKCPFDYSKGIGIGICLACGGKTCTKFGCYIPDHDCKNSPFMTWGGKR